MIIDEAERNNMNVVHPCAAGLDVHKASAAASVRVWKGGGEDGETAKRMFPAPHPGFREMTVWLSDCNYRMKTPQKRRSKIPQSGAANSFRGASRRWF